MMIDTPCPKQPNGHVWQLDRAESWYEKVERPWTKGRIAWTIVGVLIPIIGWVLVAADLDAGRTKYVGVNRIWYCVKCRTFETQHVTKTQLKEEAK